MQGDPRPKNTATSLRPQSTSSNFVTTSSRLHGTASSPRVEERAATATSPSPTPVMTVAPDCGRAQVFLVACMEYWSSESVTEATDQAHCLCYGPANDMSSGIVYVPELFDQDAEACASFYSYSVSGSPEWATTLADDWSEVTGFCAQNGPAENEGIHTEGPEYFAKQVALAAPTGDATSDGGREVALEERQSSESRAAMLNIGFAPVRQLCTALLGVEVVANVEQLLASVSWLLIYFMVI